MSGTGDTIHVLHVDDDPSLTDMVATFLEREDDRIAVQTATNADEGQEILSTDNIDCIVSDYDMPGENGIEFLESVRKANPDIPFILYTGKGSEEVASDAISAGVSDYLQKESGTEQYELLANNIVTLVEKYRTEQELDTLRRQYTKLAEQNFVGIYIIQDGEFVYANPRLADIHGYENPDEVVGKPVLELVSPEERERVQSKLNQRLSGEVEEIEYQTVGLRQDGERIDIELHGSHVEYEGDTAVIGAELDITERKQRETRLQKTAARLEALFENSPDMIDVLDSAGIILEANQRLCEELDYDEDELLGTPIWELDQLVEEDDVKTLLSEFGYGERRKFEGQFERQDGTTVPVEVHLLRLDLDGQDRFLAVSRDISERKERERELATTREASQKVIEASPMPIWVQDGEEIVYANEAATAFYGYDNPESLIGTSALSFIPENHREPARKRINQMIETGEAINELTDRFIAKDGITREAVFAATPIMYYGEQAIVVVAKDITEQKERERELRDLKDRFQTLFEKAPEEIAIHDSNGEILEVNQQVSEKLGYSRDELTSLNVADFQVGYSRDELQKLWDEISIAETRKVEGKHEQKDGSTYPVAVWINKANINGSERFLAFVRDITERKERETEIARLKERLELAVEGAELGVWDWDMTTDEVEFNEQWAQMLGFSLDEIEPHLEAWEKRVHPEDIDDVEAALDAHIAGEADYYDSEHRMRTAGGDWKWIRDIGKIFERQDDGDPVRAVGIHFDITERKMREAKLEARSTAMESSIDGMAILDANETYTFVNQAHADTYGYDDPDALLGRSWQMLYSEDEQARIEQEVIPEMYEVGSWRGEAVGQRQDGTKFPQELSLTRLVDGGLVGVVRDMTERKERERRLQRQKEKIRAIHDVVTELETCETAESVYELIVDAAESILEFDSAIVDEATDEVLVPKAVSSDPSGEQYYGETSIHDEDNFAAKAYRTGESSIVADLRTHDVAPADAEFRSALTVPIDEYGIFQTVSKSTDAFDTTDLELAELLVSHSESALDGLTHEQQLLRQNERLDEFASIVSHDLRNPLNVAQGRIELAREESSSDHLEVAADALERSLDLIDDMLTLAKAGEQISEMESVDLSSFANTCWEHVKNSDATIQTDLDLTVRADRSRLQQLFENLFRNAVEHGGETVTIRVGPLPEGFFVEDDGPGIPEDEREDVFKEGYSESQEGTGLGLAIVKQIVEAHGWEIRIGEGSEGGARLEITGVDVSAE